MANEANVSLLSHLDTSQDFWNIKVRIICLWKLKYTIEMVLLDERGDKMQASVKQRLWPRIESQLHQDDMVVIAGCGVAEVNDKYDRWRVIDRKYKVNFYDATTVSPIFAWQGPAYGFDFIPFRVVCENKKAEDVVDVIGAVVTCGTLDAYGPDNTGRLTKKMNLELQDLEHRVDSK